jgi:CIC family chloride channel protein
MIMGKIQDYVGKYMIKWLFVATLVGIGGGVFASILKKSISFVSGFGDMFPVYLAPAIGGIILIFIYKWDKMAAGFGTDHYICEVNQKEDYMKCKNLFSKLLATSVTLGFKGSGGVEGPMLVMGGGIAEIISKIPFLSKFFDAHDKRVLTICGAAGAIGAIFRSPLGGGIFVVEILYHSSLHYGDLFPAMLSSTMGFIVYSMISSSTPLFEIPDYVPDVYNIPWFILTAIVAGIVSIIFMKVFTYIKGTFDSMPYKTFHPVIGGALTGVVIIFFPEVSGLGNEMIQSMVDVNFPITYLVMLLVAKMLAASFTIGSGGSAGLVIPALFIGAIAGNGVTCLISNGGDVALGSSLVIAGMAASLASIANVPVAAAIMLVEMVGLRLGVPATIGSIIGYAIGHSQVIYGITCPNEWQHSELSKLKRFDANTESH